MKQANRTLAQTEVGERVVSKDRESKREVSRSETPYAYIAPLRSSASPDKDSFSDEEELIGFIEQPLRGQRHLTVLLLAAVIFCIILLVAVLVILVRKQGLDSITGGGNSVGVIAHSNATYGNGTRYAVGTQGEELELQDAVHGAACVPYVWVGPQPTSVACMKEIWSRIECNHHYFNYVEDGDRQCACILIKDVPCTEPLHYAINNMTRIYRISAKTQPQFVTADTSVPSDPEEALKQQLSPQHYQYLGATNPNVPKNVLIVTMSTNRNIVVATVENTTDVECAWADCESVASTALNCPIDQLAWIERKLVFGTTIAGNQLFFACCPKIPIRIHQANGVWRASWTVSGETMDLRYITLQLGGWDFAKGGLRFIEMHGITNGALACKLLDTDGNLAGICK